MNEPALLPPLRSAAVMFLLALLMSACGGSGSGDSDPGPTAADLPLLPDGNHLGMTVAYEPLPAGTEAAVNARRQDALAAGMRVGRVHVSWAELEPQPQQYDLAELRERLDLLQRDGLAAFVLVETIDSEGYSLPADLMDPDDGSKLADGRAFADPLILARLHKLLDRIVPEMVSRKAWLLSVGNEPDNMLDDLGDDSPAGIAYWNNVVGFTRSARDHVRRLEPRLPVTMTLTQRGLEVGRTLYGPLIDVVDVAAFNYYCQDRNWIVQDASVVRGEIAQMVGLAGGRNVVLQEVGCPSGYTDRASVVRGTAEAQQRFLVAVANELRREKRLRAAFWFTMVDWSPELTRTFVTPIRDSGFPGLAAKYEETLRTWGLVRYEDGAPRPAWGAFLEGLAAR